MDIEDEYIYNDVSDSGNESTDEEDDGLSVALDVEPICGSDHKERMEIDDDFPYEVLTTESIVEHMIDCIRDVNTVVQVGPLLSSIVFYHVLIYASINSFHRR